MCRQDLSNTLLFSRLTHDNAGVPVQGKTNQRCGAYEYCHPYLPKRLAQSFRHLGVIVRKD